MTQTKGGKRCEVTKTKANEFCDICGHCSIKYQCRADGLVASVASTGFNDSLHASWHGLIQIVNLVRLDSSKSRLEGSPELVTVRKHLANKGSPYNGPYMFNRVAVWAVWGPHSAIKPSDVLGLDPFYC